VPRPRSSSSPAWQASGELKRWVSRKLLAWYTQHRRDLPWRANRDPYAIWVSEVMLQQTQVATVIPFFARFLKAFPDLGALARAAEQEVLRLWEGLGYYRRARDLHRTAQLLVQQGHTTFPREPALLHNLPGLGTYTRNAVLSQAFDLPLPILEANSERVLCRLLGIREDPKKSSVRTRLWQASESLVPRGRPGEFNQALMELGALVCTGNQPRCLACPLASRCWAFQNGQQDQIPTRSAPPAPTPIQESAVVLRRRLARSSRVLLVQRPSIGRWANLWEFPHAELHPGESHEAGALRVIADLTGMQAVVGQALLTLQHSVTRFRITLVCYRADHQGGKFRSSFYTQGKWVSPGELFSYPVSSPQRKLARFLVEKGE
jgi:A/G-specific adenine glycosylase